MLACGHTLDFVNRQGGFRKHAEWGCEKTRDYLRTVSPQVATVAESSGYARSRGLRPSRSPTPSRSATPQGARAPTTARDNPSQEPATQQPGLPSRGVGSLTVDGRYQIVGYTGTHKTTPTFQCLGCQASNITGTSGRQSHDLSHMPIPSDHPGFWTSKETGNGLSQCKGCGIPRRNKFDDHKKVCPRTLK